MKEENMQERGKDERGKHAGKRKDENMSKTRGKSVGEGLFSPLFCVWCLPDAAMRERRRGKGLERIWRRVWELS